jgi:riboflavin transporter FmnP
MVKLGMEKNRISTNYKLALTSIFLGLSIVFSLASEYVKIPPFSSIGLTFDLSIFCFISILIGANLRWAIAAIILQAALAYSWAAATIIGPLVLCLYNIIFILVFYFLYKAFKINKDNNRYIQVVLIYILTAVICIVVFSLLNVFAILPLFAYLFSGNSFWEPLIPGFSNYYISWFIFFAIFNSIKLGITAVIAIPVTKVVINVSKNK